MIRVLNFKKVFAPAVEAGTKPCTIRAKRKDGRDPQVGDTLRLYTGLRTQAARLLREAVCSTVKPVLIQPSIGAGDHLVWLDDQMLTAEALQQLAEQDGFANADDFVAFFRANHGLPFSGYQIGWPVTPQVAS